MTIQAVVFDWRGTLVSELTPEGWAWHALQRTGRCCDAAAVSALLEAIRDAAGEPNRMKDPTGNTSFERHRDTYYGVFRDARLASDLADALFAADSDPGLNHFAADAADTFRILAKKRCKIGVLSNIHFDIRPFFAAANLLKPVDAFILSGEQGIQKPDPAIFRRALDMLGTCAEETLMVGDRPSRDGVAVDVGMPTLLVPQLIDHRKRQLHLVTNTVAFKP